MKISDPELELSQVDYTFAVQNTTLIVHAAWAVNFSMRFAKFRERPYR